MWFNRFLLSLLQQNVEPVLEAGFELWALFAGCADVYAFPLKQGEAYKVKTKKEVRHVEKKSYSWKQKTNHWMVSVISFTPFLKPFASIVLCSKEVST